MGLTLDGEYTQTKSEGMEKTSHASGDQKKAGVAILISDKIDFRKTVIRNKQKHSAKIKGSLQ